MLNRRNCWGALAAGLLLIALACFGRVANRKVVESPVASSVPGTANAATPAVAELAPIAGESPAAASSPRARLTTLRPASTEPAEGVRTAHATTTADLTGGVATASYVEESSLPSAAPRGPVTFTGRIEPLPRAR